MTTAWQNLYTRVPDTLKTRLDDYCRENGTSIREVVTTALENYLREGQTMEYQVIEDNGGTIYLVAFSGNEVVYFASGYELGGGDLLADIEGLKAGEDPSGWEGNADAPQAAYDELTSHDYGWQVIADDDGVYHDRMGAAGQSIFDTSP